MKRSGKFSALFCLTVISGLGFAQSDAPSPTPRGYEEKPITVTQEDREKAMQERPGIFGMGVFWEDETKGPEAVAWNDLMEKRILECGMKMTRFGFDWCNLEREPGVYDWTNAEQDKQLLRLFDMGIEVLGLVCTHPTWAGLNREPLIHVPREEAAGYFIEFSKTLAARYKDKITYWEFWNEQDCTGWWNEDHEPAPNPEQYTRWLIRFYQGIKAGNPDAMVGVGGLLGRSTWFLEGIYEHGGQNYFDAVSIHPYPDAARNQGAAAFDWQQVEDHYAVMVKHGDGHKPIWNTEYGWWVDHVGLGNQAEYMRQALDYMVHYPYITIGIQHVIADWHRGSQGLMGLCDRQLNRRPAYFAWADYMGAPATPPPPDPTPTPLPPGKQLLVNPGFEEEDYDRVPIGWDTWGSSSNDPRQDFDGMVPGGEHGFAPEPRSGNFIAGKTVDHGTCRGGIYQRVRVEPGTRLAARTWACIPYAPTGMGGRLRLGLDPGGGHDPSSGRIVWTPWHMNVGQLDGWFQIGLPDPVKATGPRVTLFLEIQQNTPTGWNGMYFDDVELVRLPED